MASDEVQEEVKGVIEENQVGLENGPVEEKAITDVQDKEVVDTDGGVEDIKQVTAEGNDESLPEPDSWEDVDALEERLKTLTTAETLAADSAEKEVKGQGGSGSSSGSGGRLSPQRIVVDGRQGAVPDQVDHVLKMGLANPRDPGDRLAILRMDQEVERFLRTPNLQQLELGPLPSSYMRMAAHKVAQHYMLSTSSQVNTGLDGLPVHKVVAVKTPESRFPSLRLCDIPMVQSSPRSQGPVKLAIKPRNTGHHSNGESRQRQTGPVKSVEERNEEYQKARARIFNQEKEAAAQNGGMMRGPMGSPRSGLVGFGQEVGGRNALPMQGPMDGGYGREGSGRGGNGRANGEGGSGKKGKGPAIFRDREKEKRDPDFDRSSRFNGRYDVNYGAPMMPYMPAMFIPPQAGYSAEFPPLGAQPGMQGGGMSMGEMSPHGGGQMPVSWMPAMVGGPGGGQPFAAPGSPIQFAPGVQPFSPPGGQFVGPMSSQFAPGGQAYMSMAPFPQQGVYTSPNGQQFMTPQFVNQQFPQNQGMQFRGPMQYGVPANGGQFNPGGGQFRPPPQGGGVQFSGQPGQPQQGVPNMNGQFQGGGNGQGFAPPMFGPQPMGGFAVPGGVVYVSPEQFQGQAMDQFRPPHPPTQQLSPPPQQSQPPPRRR